MNDQMTERVTSAIAATAVTSPAWFPYIEKALSVSLSVLGVIWLAVQIFYKVKNGK